MLPCRSREGGKAKRKGPGRMAPRTVRYLMSLLVAAVDVTPGVAPDEPRPAPCATHHAPRPRVRLCLVRVVPDGHRDLAHEPELVPLDPLGNRVTLLGGGEAALRTRPCRPRHTTGSPAHKRGGPPGSAPSESMRLSAACELVEGGEATLEVGDDVVDVLRADGEADRGL